MTWTLCCGSDHADRHRPAVLNTTNDLPDDALAVLRIRAYGFDQDRQAKDRQWFTATTPPVLKYLEENAPDESAAMAAAQHAAETVGKQLRWALRTAWRDVASHASGPERRLRTGPGPRAPPRCTGHAPNACSGNAQDAAHQAEPPLLAFVRLALDVIEETIEAQERPRVAKAAIHARGLVRSLLNSKETAA